mmetsp:Transcript_130991/g.310668  ORF Transcript_130991/g.310668 Transcript_130991/m.310668 type:complete len:360 (-) Transcript_130991:1374-2453(-)
MREHCCLHQRSGATAKGHLGRQRAAYERHGGRSAQHVAGCCCHCHARLRGSLRRLHKVLARCQRSCERAGRQRIGRPVATEDLLRWLSPIAVRKPLLAEDGLELVPHKARSVAEGRGQHNLPQILPQHGQGLKIAAEAFDLGDVSFLGLSCKLSQANCAEQCVAHSGPMGAAHQTHRWHSHEQRLAGGGGVGVWEGVKRNVHLVVDVQVLVGRRRQSHELQPMLGNAVRLELCNEGGLDIWGVETLVLHQQLAVWNLVQATSPQCDDGLAHFRKAAEASEGDVAVSQSRQGLYFRHAGWWGVAEEAPRYAYQFLAEGLLSVLRIDNVIHQPVVNCAQPRGVVVADVSDLDGRRLQCNHI